MQTAKRAKAGAKGIQEVGQERSTQWGDPARVALAETTHCCTISLVGHNLEQIARPLRRRREPEPMSEIRRI
jgi:hypothetical protein